MENKSQGEFAEEGNTREHVVHSNNNDRMQFRESLMFCGIGTRFVLPSKFKFNKFLGFGAYSTQASFTDSQTNQRVFIQKFRLREDGSKDAVNLLKKIKLRSRNDVSLCFLDF